MRNYKYKYQKYYHKYHKIQVAGGDGELVEEYRDINIYEKIDEDIIDIDGGSYYSCKVNNVDVTSPTLKGIKLQIDKLLS